MEEECRWAKSSLAILSLVTLIATTEAGLDQVTILCFIYLQLSSVVLQPFSRLASFMAIRKFPSDSSTFSTLIVCFVVVGQCCQVQVTRLCCHKIASESHKANAKG